MELVEKLIDNRNGKLVLRRLSVEGLVVDAKTPGVVRLVH
jgi:kynureninase